MKFTTNSAQETQRLAKTVLKQLQGKNTVALYGQLGAGKTTFIQGLAKELGIKKRLTSPTFILMRQYQLPKGAVYNSMLHLDLYRLNLADDLRSIDLDEIISNPKNLVVIEWAEKAKKILPQNRLDIKFTITGENERKITTKSDS